MHINKLLFVFLLLICFFFFLLQGFQPNTQKGRGKIILPPLHYPTGGVLNMFAYVWDLDIYLFSNRLLNIPPPSPHVQSYVVP